MKSLFDELEEKVGREPRLTRRNMPRADLGLLLFNARLGTRELWLAAAAAIEREVRDGRAPEERLRAAVEQLRPIFGERA